MIILLRLKSHPFTFLQDIATSGYVAPRLCAEAFNDVAMTHFLGREKKELKILDIGCGTGQVGEHLHQLGFHNIDALDASEEMLEQCKAKGVYKNYICAYLTDKAVDIEASVYDGLVSAAAVTPGQIRPIAFDEILRWMKPGKFFCPVSMSVSVSVSLSVPVPVSVSVSVSMSILPCPVCLHFLSCLFLHLSVCVCPCLFKFVSVSVSVSLPSVFVSV